MYDEEYFGIRKPLLIGGDSLSVNMELAASYPQGTVLNEDIDPLRDFRDFEKILGFSCTGECEWKISVAPVGSAALWEVHDYHNRPAMLGEAPEDREWATFLLTVAVTGDRLPLRPLFAVWSLVLSSITPVTPMSLTMSIGSKDGGDWQPYRPEYLIRSHAYQDKEPDLIFQDISDDDAHVLCRVTNSEGDTTMARCKQFTPLRLVENFELLTPAETESPWEEFYVQAALI
ncbi:hypothetical protein [Corynebacterium sp. 21KM1197]|uniref:hypothetical protein n=1 Tax=Corynebacterium sp. 21KM1197 TaxID=2989734 RepID=UPI0029CA2538|nr:hypothetical protein [Corynebacterium sp. 21KM1197]WPF67851.1 hypothetical protein OLW90_07130 [Corynebacterium sp. 21KM1197]